jgi:hypothetical protein
MHAIAMVHKMQRLALNNSSSMDVDEAHKCTTIEEEEEVEEGIWVLTNMAYRLDSSCLLDVWLTCSWLACSIIGSHSYVL